MATLVELRSRLRAGYYNSNPLTAANPGGLASGGHQLNFPQALRDLGEVLVAAATDAETFAAAMPQIQAAVGAVAAAQGWATQAQAYRDQALGYRNQAQEIVGTDLTLKANLNSPAFTGTPTAPTPPANDSSNRIATQASVDAKIALLTGAAPAALNTVYELAAAVNSDPNFATTVFTALSGKFDKGGGVISGDVTIGAGGRQIQLNGSDGSIEIVRSGGGAYIDFKDSENEDWDCRIDSTAGDLVLRSLTGAVKVGTNTIWHAANLSPVDLGSAQTVTGTKYFTRSITAMATLVGGLSPLEIQGVGTGVAIMAFHRPGYSSGYLGLDVDNVLKWGGWGQGAVASRLWHEGNDGAGSGMDADLFRGAAPATTATANTIMKRDANGNSYQTSGYFSNWVRATGQTGFVCEDYGGGFYMTDVNYVRVYGNKHLITDGRMYAAGFNVTSDRRLKSSIEPLQDVGALVDRLGVYSYDKAERREWGVIAQELAAEPRLAHLVGDTGQAPAEGEPPVLTVDANGLLALALAELKAVRGRLAKLESGR